MYQYHANMEISVQRMGNKVNNHRDGIDGIYNTRQKRQLKLVGGHRRGIFRGAGQSTGIAAQGACEQPDGMHPGTYLACFYPLYGPDVYGTGVGQFFLGHAFLVAQGGNVVTECRLFHNRCILGSP